MRFIDYIKMAVRNLWRRKLRTFLTVIAVFIGSMSLITLLSIALGAQNVFLGQLESIGALTEISVMSDTDVQSEDFFRGGGDNGGLEEDQVKLDDALITKIEALPHVIRARPSVSKWVEKMHIKDAPEDKAGGQLVSRDPHPQDPLTLSAGRDFTSSDEKNVVIIGNGYIQDFGYENPEDILGRTVVLYTHKGDFNLETDIPEANADREEWEVSKTYEAKVIGVGLAGPFENENYITTAWARDLTTRPEWRWPEEDEWDEIQRQKEDGLLSWDYEPQPELVYDNRTEDYGYDSLVVKIDNADNVKPVQEQIKADFDVGAISAEDFLEGFLRIFLVVQIVLAAIGAISLAVAAIGIINTMVMAIYERTQEIGIMKAVGASRGAIRWLFTIEASMIGFFGGALGIVVGYGLTLVINKIAAHFLAQESFDIESVISLPWWLVGSVIGFTSLLGLLAGLYPAARAARLDPIEALHRE